MVSLPVSSFHQRETPLQKRQRQRCKGDMPSPRLHISSLYRSASAVLHRAAATHEPRLLEPACSFPLMLSRSQVKALYDQDATWSDPITECSGLDSIAANFASLALVAAVYTLPVSNQTLTPRTLLAKQPQRCPDMGHVGHGIWQEGKLEVNHASFKRDKEAGEGTLWFHGTATYRIRMTPFKMSIRQWSILKFSNTTGQIIEHKDEWSVESLVSNVPIVGRLYKRLFRPSVGLGVNTVCIPKDCPLLCSPCVHIPTTNQCPHPSPLPSVVPSSWAGTCDSCPSARLQPLRWQEPRRRAST